jgi:sterol desaturase/sphingolipid hydroxylase (fatty acid hydroxylase superfamily)
MELPSIPSIKNFALTNLYFLGYAYLETLLYNNLDTFPMILRYVYLVGMASMRNYIMLQILTKGTEKYPYLHEHKKIPRLDDYLFYFFQLLLVDAFHQIIALEYLLDSSIEYQSSSLIYTLRDILLFIPISFLFEITFDFFHYITHRAEHTFPILYKTLHKTHHMHHHPTFITTYYHNLGDLLFTNSLPLFATLILFRTYFFFPWINLLGSFFGRAEGSLIPISRHLFFAIYLAKSYIELCGHSGKDIPKTGSFVQCVWLPRLFGIELYTEDHDRHHQYSNGNYGKRFALWDIAFGTTLLARSED